MSSAVMVPRPPSQPRQSVQQQQQVVDEQQQQQLQNQLSQFASSSSSQAQQQQHQNPLLSEPGHSYSPADLQRQFVGMSVRDVYALLCRRNNCRVISSVIEQLPEKPGVWELQQLDLERTYVGHRGVVPVIELCKLLHKLQSISFANNFLTNKSVWFACQMLMFHPTVSTVSFASNDISWTAGMCILELVTRNANIRSVDVTETLFQPKVTQAILAQVRRNIAGSTGKEQKKRSQASSPINHARAVRIRALKRLFRDLVSKKGNPADQKVPRECVIEGLRAQANLSGRERELEQRGGEYLKAIVSRAPADHIDWEAFLLVVLFPEIPFRKEHVDSLRKLFNSVNSDGSGYVFVSEIPAMLAAVLGHPPTPEEVHSKMAYFGLSQDDNVTTMTFDEFLVLVCEHGPEIGEHLTNVTKTPISVKHGMKPPHH
jgi:hypothetical protein